MIQKVLWRLIIRYREQARSHKDCIPNVGASLLAMLYLSQ
jgi:hypothetical protein